jgi:hypothetical protein
MGAGEAVAYLGGQRRRLGHGSLAITAQVYMHLIEDEDRRRKRRDRLDALYGGPAIAAAGP